MKYLFELRDRYEMCLRNDFDTGSALKVLLNAINHFHSWKMNHTDIYLIHTWTAEFLNSCLLELGVDFSFVHQVRNYHR